VTPALLVMAKAPAPGRSKTRLTPPCTPRQAAALARAALEDTLASVARSRLAGRRIVVLDGEPDGWLPPGFEVLPQRGAGLAERLAAAFDDVGGPALLVGMDTPQVASRILDDGLAALAGGADAVFAPAPDGGYWAIGLRRADPAVFAGIPMSAPDTGTRQRARLEALGLRVACLPPFRDVDTIHDARRVAVQAPAGRFAAALARVEAVTAA
jgi:rSAM/selenodomain-associated transferase 1